MAFQEAWPQSGPWLFGRSSSKPAFPVYLETDSGKAAAEDCLRGADMGSLLSCIGILSAVLAGVLVGYMVKANKTFAQMVAVLGIWFLGAWLVVLAGTLLGLHSIYIQIYRALENAGWAPNAYLLKATVGLLTGIGYFVVSAIVTSFVSFRHRKFVVVLTFAYCGMCLVLYQVSKPQPGQAANVVTGAPLLNFYKNPDGQIEVFGKEVRFHPRYPGVPLLSITPEVYREYEQQQELQKNGTPLSWVPFSITPKWVEAKKGELNLWVEGIEVNNRTTLLHVACAGQTGGFLSGEGWLIPGVEVYIADQDGRVYQLTEESVEYPQQQTEDKRSVVKAPRRILRGEIFRYILAFPAIPKETKRLSLYHGQFGGTPIQLSIQPQASPANNPAKRLSFYSKEPIRWLGFKLDPSRVDSQGFVGGEDGQDISLRVEQVGIGDKWTVLNLLATTGMGDRKLYSAKAGRDRTYLIDYNKWKNPLALDLGDYQADGVEPPFRILSHESYRFQLTFAKLEKDTLRFTFYHWQFKPIVVDVSEPKEDAQKTGGP
ncbi:MAG: hypothetical protein NTX98_01085 [Candidatus Doudnabacteria bacterium]|nr:hypothetical protein [Candidatus Doudnabacteria bacterium]